MRAIVMSHGGVGMRTPTPLFPSSQIFIEAWRSTVARKRRYSLRRYIARYATEKTWELKKMKKLGQPFAFLLGAVTVAIVVIAAYIYSGWYNIGADRPHWRLTASVIETLRERSIERRAAAIKVPDLSDRQLILKGAGQYAAMCTQCHLAPGKSDSEIRPGLYPQPPDLSKVRIDPRIAFWVIKHGIKMSAMPAWGTGHDDATIWSIVAFLNRLPELSPAAYREIVAKAPPDEEMEAMEHGTGMPAAGGMRESK